MWLLILLEDKKEINLLLNMNRHGRMETTWDRNSEICNPLNKQHLNAYCVPATGPRLRQYRDLKKQMLSSGDVHTGDLLPTYEMVLDHVFNFSEPQFLISLQSNWAFLEFPPTCTIWWGVKEKLKSYQPHSFFVKFNWKNEG